MIAGDALDQEEERFEEKWADYLRDAPTERLDDLATCAVQAVVEAIRSIELLSVIELSKKDKGLDLSGDEVLLVHDLATSKALCHFIEEALL